MISQSSINTGTKRIIKRLIKALPNWMISIISLFFFRNITIEIPSTDSRCESKVLKCHYESKKPESTENKVIKLIFSFFRKCELSKWISAILI